MVKQISGALLLAVSLNRGSKRTLASQLCAELRDLILSGGGLQAGERLPASRTLAEQLGVSRTTVIEVYDRLVAEGLLDSRVGAGTYVSAAVQASRPRSPESAPAPVSTEPAAPEATGAAPEPTRLSQRIRDASPRFVARVSHLPRAFTTALPAYDAFPIGLWSRLIARHWRGERHTTMGYGDPRGFMPLRRAIATHLRINRGIECEPEQIFIVGGAQQAFHLIGTVLLDPGDKVWFENPGAIGARNSLIACGAHLIPTPVDGEGLVVAEGWRQAPDFRLAFVTPSHQQPLGAMMSLERRFELLRSADEARAMVVEDDYDGEFCFGRHVLPTLKSVDTTGRVIYVGTFSKTLFPALRLGYVLAPERLVRIFEDVSGAFLQGVALGVQAVVAELLDEGHFATHIRRMRRIYAERHRVLLDAARARLAGLLQVEPTESGLHTIGLLAPHLEARRVTAAAAARDITVTPIDRFCLAPIATRGLVLGFSGIPPQAIRSGVEALGAAMESLGP